MYYAKKRVDSIKKYHSLFFDISECKIKGEASVSYLFYKEVPEKLFNYNPKAKIIIMLRNPIDRAFSHYLMDYRLGIISDSFEDIVLRKSNHKNASLFFQQYIEVSEYAKQIKRYFDTFPPQNIMIIDYDEFKIDVAKSVNDVYSFLSVDNKFRANLKKKHNTFSMPKNRLIRYFYSFVSFRKILRQIIPLFCVKKIRSILFKDDRRPILSSKIRMFLYNYFREDVIKTSSITNKDFTKWIK